MKAFMVEDERRHGRPWRRSWSRRSRSSRGMTGFMAGDERVPRDGWWMRNASFAGGAMNVSGSTPTHRQFAAW